MEKPKSSRFDAKTGEGEIYSLFSQQLVFKCSNLSWEQFGAVEKAVRVAERNALFAGAGLATATVTEAVAGMQVRLRDTFKKPL